MSSDEPDRGSRCTLARFSLASTSKLYYSRNTLFIDFQQIFIILCFKFSVLELRVKKGLARQLYS